MLNGQSSNWRLVKAGAPQGFVLGTLIFLIYMNHLPQGFTSDLELFVDDTSLFFIFNCAKVSVLRAIY